MPSAATIKSCLLPFFFACERFLTHLGERFLGLLVGFFVGLAVGVEVAFEVVVSSVVVSVSDPDVSSVAVSDSVSVSVSDSVVVSSVLSDGTAVTVIEVSGGVEDCLLQDDAPDRMHMADKTAKSFTIEFLMRTVYLFSSVIVRDFRVKWIVSALNAVVWSLFIRR